MNYNILKNNDYGVNIDGTSDFTINFNNFIENVVSHIEGHHAGQNNTLIVDATKNWWETTSISNIKEKIYDNDDIATNYAFIDIIPIENNEIEGCGSSIE